MLAKHVLYQLSYTLRHSGLDLSVIPDLIGDLKQNAKKMK